jgi:hypothetical protein
MDIEETMALKGCLNVQVWRVGKLIDEWEDKNMILAPARSALAALLGGGGSAKVINRIGFGTNGTAPTPSDTALTSGYVKSVGAVTYPGAGQVRFAWSLAGSEANGKTLREFGLVCTDGTLFSRKVRGAIEKESDISLTGTWTISF